MVYEFIISSVLIGTIKQNESILEDLEMKERIGLFPFGLSLFFPVTVSVYKFH